jgi:hypothetical protein
VQLRAKGRTTALDQTPMMRPRRLAIGLACAAGLAACGSSSKPGSTTSSLDPGIKFAQCMRAQGVSDFPDPSGGTIALTPSEAHSPAFQSAQQACQHLMPTKGPPPHMTSSELSRAFVFAKCMRSHGVPSFPDPQGTRPTSGGPTLVLQGMLFKVGPGVDPGSPAFRQSVRRCGVRLP